MRITTAARQLPVDGGFDSEGNLTKDPAAILKSWRALPVGYWKGSGLSIVLDMMAAMMTVGNATHQLAADPLLESGVSQMFLTMNPAALGSAKVVDKIADEIVASVQNSTPATAGKPVRYPGEQTLRVRAENIELGLPVEPATWEKILAM